MKNAFRSAVCLALPLLGLIGCRETREYVAVNATAAAAVRGAQLFAQHCAVCHGDDGRGDGAARPYLYPPARNFGLGSFRLSTTDNGVSSDEDLLATLSRGMPGSAMPAWSWMREKDLRALVLHVRTLARDGLVARARSAALQDGETFDRAATTARVERSLRPGRSITRPSPADYASASPERGKLLYEQNCANCHGADGKGNRKQVAWNNDGSINWARDFTSGFLKGGSSREALAARIQVGLPGSAMPAHGNFSPADVAALTLHLEKLIPPQSDRWLVHRQERVVAHRLIGSVPSDPLDELWRTAREFEVIQAPLLWHDDAVFAVHISALHDGHTLALRMRWSDATRDDSVLEDVLNYDALALAFSNEETPPLFGMGSHEHPVNLWHWRAARMIDTTGVLDLIDALPHVMMHPVYRESRLDAAPLYVPAPSSAISGGRLKELSAETLGDVGDVDRENGAPVGASARWQAGEWSLVLTRSLAGSKPGEVSFESGQQVLFSSAVWNGSSGDHGGAKSISIWQKLLLE